MLKKLLLALILAASSAFGQTAYQSYAVTPAGKPIQFIQVYVCSTGSTGTAPCSPTITVYKDKALSQPITQPVVGDVDGNFKFYIPTTVLSVDLGYSAPTIVAYKQTDIAISGGSTANVCAAAQFVGADLTAQTAAAFGSGCPTVSWAGTGTISSGPVLIGTGQTILCGAGTYTLINGGASPNAIEIVNGSHNAAFIGTGGCNIVNHQTPAYAETNNVPSAAFIVCSQTVANCDTTAPDTSINFAVDCLVGSTSCAVPFTTGLVAGQDVVIGSNRGDGAYVISPTWNGSSPVVFTRPMDDSYTVANGAFIGFFTNGFTKNWHISNVNITGNCAGAAPCVGHGIFIHNAFYGTVDNINASGLGGRIAVANGYSAFLDYDHLFYDASQSITPSNNGFEPGYVLTSHTRASNSTVVGAPANCIAMHGYHVQASNLQGFGCGESGLQLDTLQDYTDTGSHYRNNGTNGINVAGDSGFAYATDITLADELVDYNADNGIGAGIGGNVKIKIHGLKAYNNIGNNAADGGGVFFDAIQAGSMVTDSIICGGVRGIYLDGSNSYLTFSNITFKSAGNCAANSGSDIALRSGTGAVTNTEFTNLNFGATQPISSSDCTTLDNGNANTIWGLTNLGTNCGAGSGIITGNSNILYNTQGMTLAQLTAIRFAATGTPSLTLNGANAIVLGSSAAGGGTFPTIAVGSLPSATANNGSLFVVTDSTTISAEGQTCVGGSTTRALAFASGGTWKCF